MNIDLNSIDYTKYTCEPKNHVFIHTKKDNKKKPIIVELPYLCVDNDITFDRNKYLIVNLICKDNGLTNSVIDFFDYFERKIIEDTTKYINNTDNDLKYKSMIYDYKNTVVIILDLQNPNIKFFDKNNNIISKRDYKKYLDNKCYVKLLLEFDQILVSENIYSVNIVTHQIKIIEDIL